MPKVIKSGPRPDFFAKGGDTHMHGQQHAGTQEPGITSHAVKGGEKKFAEGGKGHMFGKQNANTVVPGQTGKSG